MPTLSQLSSDSPAQNTRTAAVLGSQRDKSVRNVNTQPQGGAAPGGDGGLQLSDSDPGPTGKNLGDFGSTAQPLDRENLPAEFSLDAIKHLSGYDVDWLETEAELTDVQRSTLRSAVKEMLGGIAEKAQVRVGRRTMTFTRSVPDDLGRRLQGTLKDLDDSLGSPPGKFTNPFAASGGKDMVTRHEEQLESLRQLAKLVSQLVQRTEQQHAAAERQKTTNWILGVIAIASMVGTFATINKPIYGLIAFSVTAGLAGVLDVIMNRQPPAL